MSTINISKAIYDLISQDSDVIAYSGITIDWNIAKDNSEAPNIILNDITQSTNILGRRLVMFQVSVWESSKLASETLRDIIINVLNRYKGGDIKYINLDSCVSAYDNEVKEYGYHITFKIKVLDSQF